MDISVELLVFKEYILAYSIFVIHTTIQNESSKSVGFGKLAYLLNGDSLPNIGLCKYIKILWSRASSCRCEQPLTLGLWKVINAV